MIKLRATLKNNYAGLIVLMCVLVLVCSACSGPNVAEAQSQDGGADGFQIVKLSTPEVQKTAEAETWAANVKAAYPCVGDADTQTGVVLRKVSNNTLLVQIGQDQKRVTLIGVSPTASGQQEISYDNEIGQNIIIVLGSTPISSDGREMGYVFTQHGLLNEAIINKGGGVFAPDPTMNSQCDSVLQSEPQTNKNRQ